MSSLIQENVLTPLSQYRLQQKVDDESWKNKAKDGTNNPDYQNKQRLNRAEGKDA